MSEFIKKFKGEPVLDQVEDYGVIDVAHRAFEAMKSTIARQKLAACLPDHTIEIPRNV